MPSKVELQARAPEFVFACIKASMQAPENYVFNGESRLFTTPDIKEFTGVHKAAVFKATALIREATPLLKDSGCDRAIRTKLKGDLETRLVFLL